MTELVVHPGELDGKLRQCMRCRAMFVFDFWSTSYCQNCEHPGAHVDLTREAIERELYRERNRRSLKRG